MRSKLRFAIIRILSEEKLAYPFVMSRNLENQQYSHLPQILPRDDTSISSPRSEAAKDLWQDEGYRKKVIGALKEYKTSVKNLIVAVRTAAGKVKPSPSPTATP